MLKEQTKHRKEQQSGLEGTEEMSLPYDIDAQDLELELERYLDLYDLPWPCRVVKEESGKNNTTRIVYSGGNRYVLRLYDNHKEQAKVRLEHRVLHALSRMELGFSVPRPVACRSGGTIAVGKDGKLAALYIYIEGQRPDGEYGPHIYGLGQACGTMSGALDGLTLEDEPAYTPYYKLSSNYEHLDAAEMASWVRADEQLTGLLPQLELLERVRGELMEAEAQLSSLPEQWVHGDVVFTNAVARGEEVVGVLDFEFCTIDLRAMELAVVLPELIVEGRTERSLERLELFVEGFGSRRKLTAEEITAIPALMKLRMADVHLHFADRYQQQLDPPQEWAEQMQRTAFVCGWIEAHEPQLMELLRRHLPLF